MIDTKMKPTDGLYNKSHLNSTFSSSEETGEQPRANRVSFIHENKIYVSNIFDQNLTEESHSPWLSISNKTQQTCGNNAVSNDYDTSSSSSTDHRYSEYENKTQTATKQMILSEKDDKLSIDSQEYEYRTHHSSLSVLNELELDKMSAGRNYSPDKKVDEEIASLSTDKVTLQSNSASGSQDLSNSSNLPVTKEENGPEKDLIVCETSPSLSVDNSQCASEENAFHYGFDENEKRPDERSVLLLEGHEIPVKLEDFNENVTSGSNGIRKSPTITLDEVLPIENVNRDEILSEKEIKEFEKLSPMFSKSSAEKLPTLQVPHLEKGAIVDIHAYDKSKEFLENSKSKNYITSGKGAQMVYTSKNSLISGDQKLKHKFLSTCESPLGPFCRHGRGIRGERIHDEFCNEDYAQCHCQLHKRIIKRSNLKSLCHHHGEEIRELYGSKIGGHYSNTETDLLCYKHDMEVKHGRTLQCHCVLQYGGMGVLRALQNGVNLYDLCYEHDEECSQYTHVGDRSANHLHHCRLRYGSLCQQHDEYMKQICQEYDQSSCKVDGECNSFAKSIKNNSSCIKSNVHNSNTHEEFGSSENRSRHVTGSVYREEYSNVVYCRAVSVQKKDNIHLSALLQ